LQAVRRQYLDDGDQISLDILFCPLLLTESLEAPNFLIEKYLLWNRDQDEPLFPDINLAAESLFRELLPEVRFDPLVNRYQSFDQLEIYDDMGGLAACKPLLGPARDIKNSISEHFSWLDYLDNFDHLFNDVTLEEIGQQIRKVSGIKAGWQFKKEQKGVLSILKRVKKMLDERKLLQQLSASHHTRKIWTRHLAEYMEAVSLCQLLVGEISFKKFQKRRQRGYEFTPAKSRTSTTPRSCSRRKSMTTMMRSSCAFSRCWPAIASIRSFSALPILSLTGSASCMVRN